MNTTTLSLQERLRNTAKTTGLDAVVDLLVEAADALDCQQAKADPSGLFMLDRGTVLDAARRAGIEYKELGRAHCETFGLPLNSMGTIEVQFTSFYRFAVLMARHGVESEQKRHADIEEVARKAEAYDESVKALNDLVIVILKAGHALHGSDQGSGEGVPDSIDRDFVAAMQATTPFLADLGHQAEIASMLPPLEIVWVPVDGTEGGQV